MRKIEDIADIQIGLQFRGKIEFDLEGTHQVIQIKDMDDDYRLQPRGLYKIKPERETRKYLVKRGDVLFVSKGNRNFATAINRDLENTVAAGHFFILRMKQEDVLPEYLAWYINQGPARIFLECNKRGSNMPVVPKGVFKKMNVEVPPVEIQKIIVKLEELQRKEARLMSEIQDKRSAMVNAMCIKAARQGGE